MSAKDFSPLCCYMLLFHLTNVSQLVIIHTLNVAERTSSFNIKITIISSNHIIMRSRMSLPVTRRTVINNNYNRNSETALTYFSIVNSKTRWYNTQFR